MMGRLSLIIAALVAAVSAAPSSCDNGSVPSTVRVLEDSFSFLTNDHTGISTNTPRCVLQ